MDRFWSRVDVGLCWEWVGTRLPTGYGTLGIGKKRVYAHRHAWEFLVGPIPEGLVMDHLCRNPPCVNPDHLEPVTEQENIARGFAGVVAGLQRAARTHCPHGHEFNDANTVWFTNTRNGKPYRQCRECRRSADRRRVFSETEREKRRERERRRRQARLRAQAS